MSLFYAGDKTGRAWKDLWLVAESIELTLNDIHSRYGYAGVCSALDQDDRLEHWLSRVAGEQAYLKTGELAVMEEITTSKPPGQADLAPAWSMASAREAAKALYLQQGRVKAQQGGKGSTGQGSDDDGPVRRRPRRRAGKEKGAPSDDGKPKK